MENSEHESSAGELALPSGENGDNGANGTSPKQIAANRRNAMRSTGPRTVKGKLASKFNATKHGLRANEIVIPGQEEPAEFDALLQEHYDDWKPEGRTEIGLVREIAIAEWRLLRAHRAELGEIRKQIADATSRREEDETIRVQRLTPSLLPETLRRSTTGIDHLKFVVEGAMAELNDTGTVSRETCDYLDELFGDTADNPTLWLKIWFFDEVPRALRPFEGKSTSQATGTKPDPKAAALEELEICLNRLERLKRKVRRQDKLSREIELQRLSIPSGPGLEQLQRYETAINRDLHRTIDLLERLQRRRRGEPPPPTVNVNVSKDD